MYYVIKILSDMNILEDEIEVTEDELLNKIQELKEDFLDRYPGYTLEITANL